ncbi:MmgE/PrpD family protein [Nocardia sp. NPDC004604]|uniref:MmgE/PrpD family protein n=1 Tax=Nocardia sp. NPDC004604 TaxID=3157013 RepID=UPI0033BE81AA
MTPQMPLLQPLATRAAGLGFEAIPPQIVQQAKWSLLDTIGRIIAGPDSRRTLEAEIELGSRQHRSATVGVTGDRLPFPAAAKTNSAFASIPELDDNTAGHGSLVTVPVGLAVAEAHHLDGRALPTSMTLASAMRDTSTRQVP